MAQTKTVEQLYTEQERNDYKVGEAQWDRLIIDICSLVYRGRTIRPLYTCVPIGIISEGQGSPIYWLLLTSRLNFIKNPKIFKSKIVCPPTSNQAWANDVLIAAYTLHGQTRSNEYLPVTLMSRII